MNGIDDIENAVISVLNSKHSFRIEAGPGAGKTYSLTRLIEWIQAHQWDYYHNSGKKVACITYTNAAVDVIKQRLKDDSFIVPSTIHSFAWEVISDFKERLIYEINNNAIIIREDIDIKTNEIKDVRYTLGYQLVEDKILYLHHDDVIELFARLMENGKFRRIIYSRYPLLLIDEYQDTSKKVMDVILRNLNSKSWQLGLFGDSWQTIYTDLNACGEIHSEQVEEIQKGINRRSSLAIVNALNQVRPDFQQVASKDAIPGEVIVISCDDYSGIRRTDNYYRNDLQKNDFHKYINDLTTKIQNTYPNDNLKVLMITHKLLAAQQNYESLLAALGDRFKKEGDDVLNFISGILQPVRIALKNGNINKLYDALGGKTPIIMNRRSKSLWREFESALNSACSERIIDVLTCIKQYELIPLPARLHNIMRAYVKNPNETYGKTTVQNYLNIEYSQFENASQFLRPDSVFSTEHGVKGEEYDNVILVISKGWHKYAYEKYIPRILSGDPPGNAQDPDYIRNRNLFYVCCSRARKRLFILITIPMAPELRNSLLRLTSSQEIYAFNEYINS